MTIRDFHAAHGRPIGNVERTVLHTCLATTQAGAIAAAPYVGKKQKNAADGSAVGAMELVLEGSEYPCIIQIGEGEADEAPGLHHGQRFGVYPAGLTRPVVQLVADPIEGTDLLANGEDNAVSFLGACLTGYGHIKPGPDEYVESLVLPRFMGDALLLARKTRELPRGVPRQFDLDVPLLVQPFGVVVRSLAVLTGMSMGDMKGESLKRERNDHLTDELLRVGGSQRLIRHGDIMSPVRVHKPKYKDVTFAYGIGGSAEATARAIITQVYKGYLELRTWIDPSRDRATQVANFEKHDYQIDRVYSLNEIARGRVMFSITAITNTGVLDGITFDPQTRWLHSSSLYGRNSTGSVYAAFGEHTRPPKRR